MSETSFISVQNCFVTKGYNRSAVIDTQRKSIYYVPHEIQDILEYRYGNTVEQVRKQSNIEEELLDEYFEFLVSQELIYHVPEFLKDSFPEVNKEFRLPVLSETVILEYAGNLPKLEDWDFLGTKFLEVRTTYDHLEAFVKDISILNESTLHSIAVIITGDNVIDKPTFLNIQQLDENPRVISVLAECKEEIESEFNSVKWVRTIEFDSDEVVVDTNLVFNIKFFMESNFVNPYYNSKIYIDAQGEIYNTPKKRKHFGSLESLRDLNEYSWNHELNVPNSEVEECKFCEHRFACLNSLDRRQNELRNLYNAVECSYNPFISKWSYEEGYLTLEESGVISNEKGLNIDSESLKAINFELWEG